MELVMTWLWDRAYGYGIYIVVVLLIALICWHLYSRYQSHIETLLLATPSPLYFVDVRSGEILYANRQAMQLLGIRQIGVSFRFPTVESENSFRHYLTNHINSRAFEQVSLWALSEFESFKINLVGRKVHFRNKQAWMIHASPYKNTNEEMSQEVRELNVARTALDSLSELIYVKDQKGQLVTSNRSFKKFWHGRAEEGTLSVSGGVLKGRVSERSWTTDQDGKSCLLETYQSVLLSQDGSTIGTLSISHDVTDWHDMQQKLRGEMEKRKDTEVALAQRDTILQNILEASPDSIGIFNENMVYQACNKPFVAALGISEVSDLIGKRLQDVVPHSIYTRISETDHQVLHQSKSLRYIDKVVSSDGAFTWYDVVKSPFRDPASSTNGVLIMARDITERYLAEQKLEEANLELERLSFMDSLTKVSNRRRFDEQLSTLWHYHVREKLPLTIMLCDIDFFKGYNDYYGHQQGDDALIQVSQAFKQVLNRSSDCVARYGGEEFGFILPNTTTEGAQLVAQRIHDEVLKLELAHEKSTVSEFITVSIGIVSYIPKPDDEMESAVALADSALYQAKSDGRNRSMVHPSSIC
ncbi:PAS domain S-box-containing protein/diguanylate cyclase (GGDEF)-like protein [Vibrio crassostreae]|uniref:sensor domain-containing diguanylate cyclase n=1 Tax=Vibrio crassostreae TaxID=246167 RepID=UPI001B30108F|nr:diguanylate cyclase [Vibrio crassostreae]CAK2831315.1 PAS domain S-box-containing protein/diguanylate cyclase (GGDEF)-like protein [Vibrio crassostreae]CAK2834317.1 PAS domain S-box-containing protein/diguanylate cyclase (GGDEF)-like protein [Vibrio crassostreae]CAK2840681.1 PAS domain S-box-containing protein/diguanylate cyclase (GGDEF)-like protein [Vibrio crassostreae]CAK2927445.1 PAS domain S-box-containing protein/diguanylate cyclase (GGDEF)-like protein [Vibrio crassostreae]CAK2927453